MLRRLVLLLLLICAAGMLGCASAGPVVRPSVCPVLPPLPANLMHPPETEKRVREELFEPPPSATLKSADSKLY